MLLLYSSRKCSNKSQILYLHLAACRHPNTACELLTSDVSDIYEKLCEDVGLMGKVYGFLEAEGPLNPLLASFFSKVMGLLINRKSEVVSRQGSLETLLQSRLLFWLHVLWWHLPWWYHLVYHFDGSMQERCNSVTNPLELHLSCTNLLILEIVYYSSMQLGIVPYHSR